MCGPPPNCHKITFALVFTELLSANVVGLRGCLPPPTDFYFPPILKYTLPHCLLLYSNDNAEMNGRHSTVRRDHST